MWVGWELYNCGMGLLPSTIVIVIRMKPQQETMKYPSIPCWEEVKHWGSAGMTTLEELSLSWPNQQTN